MKLEAYWILTNLCMGTADVVALVVGLESELVCELSMQVPLYQIVETHLLELAKTGMKDLQMFLSMCHFIDNAIHSQSTAITDMFWSKTSIVSCIE